MAQIMTPAEFAEIVKSDGRTVRKFLRSITPREEQPGKGSRWQLKGNKQSVTALTKKFNAWTVKQDELRAKREAEKAAEVETDEVETPDED